MKPLFASFDARNKFLCYEVEEGRFFKIEMKNKFGWKIFCLVICVRMLILHSIVCACLFHNSLYSFDGSNCIASGAKLSFASELILRS